LITTRISSTDTAGTNTFTSGGVLGVKGGDNAKFDSANLEQLSFEFDHPVVLRQLLFTALNYNGETMQVSINGEVASFNRTDAQMSASGWGDNRFIYTFDPPMELSAGTEVQVGATAGQWGLEGVVVRAGALTTA